MESFDPHTATATEPRSRRPLSSRLADLGDRIAKALPPPRREPEYSFPVGPAALPAETELVSEAEPIADSEPISYPTEEFHIRRVERESADDILPRFPVTRQGYDCDAVDTHIAELEDELDDLERQLDEARAQVPSRDEVAIEIEKIGERTSAILVAAHDEAQETIRLARTHADTVIADASSYAAALTEEAMRKVTELQSRAESLDREHERRISELRGTAEALRSLADGASDRFPAS